MKACIILAIIALIGCKTEMREQSEIEKRDRISVSGTVTMPTPDGMRAMPISVTIDRTGTEDQRKTGASTSGIDGSAIGREVAGALAPILTASTGGMPWASIMSGIGAAATAAGTGYLALKKREQLRGPRK